MAARRGRIGKRESSARPGDRLARRRSRSARRGASLRSRAVTSTVQLLACQRDVVAEARRGERPRRTHFRERRRTAAGRADDAAVFLAALQHRQGRLAGRVLSISTTETWYATDSRYCVWNPLQSFDISSTLQRLRRDRIRST